MSARTREINVKELHERVAVEAAVTPRELYALMDVLEAAQVVEVEASYDKLTEEARAKLYNALLRFDFGPDV